MTATPPPPLPDWIRVGEAVYAVYFSDRDKLELYRKYTVASISDRYVSCRDYFNNEAPPRRFHRNELSVARGPDHEELIGPGPRLERAKLAGALTAAHAEVTRRHRATQRDLTDATAMLSLFSAVAAARGAIDRYEDSK